MKVNFLVDKIESDIDNLKNKETGYVPSYKIQDAIAEGIKKYIGKTMYRVYEGKIQKIKLTRVSSSLNIWCCMDDSNDEKMFKYGSLIYSHNLFKNRSDAEDYNLLSCSNYISQARHRLKNAEKRFIDASKDAFKHEEERQSGE